MIPFLTPHPVQADNQFAGHRYHRDRTLTTNRQVYELTFPLRVTPYGDLRCLDQQKTQQGTALLADVSYPSLVRCAISFAERPELPQEWIYRNGYTEKIPAVGVYVTFAKVRAEVGTKIRSRQLRSVTHVGRPPTFGERELGVETHLLEPWEGLFID